MSVFFQRVSAVQSFVLQTWPFSYLRSKTQCVAAPRGIISNNFSAAQGLMQLILCCWGRSWHRAVATPTRKTLSIRVSESIWEYLKLPELSEKCSALHQVVDIWMARVPDLVGGNLPWSSHLVVICLASEYSTRRRQPSINVTPRPGSEFSKTIQHSDPGMNDVCHRDLSAWLRHSGGGEY